MRFDQIVRWARRWKWVDAVLTRLESYTSLKEQYPWLGAVVAGAGAVMLTFWTALKESWWPLAIFVGLASYALFRSWPKIMAWEPQSPVDHAEISVQAIDHSKSADATPTSAKPSGQLSIAETLARWHFLRHLKDELESVRATVAQMQPSVEDYIKNPPADGYSRSGNDVRAAWNRKLKEMDSLFRQWNEDDPNISKSSYMDTAYPVPDNLSRLSFQDQSDYRKFYEQLTALQTEAEIRFAELHREERDAWDLIKQAAADVRIPSKR